jgi:uncharacterized protein (DUF1697 family)
MSTTWIALLRGINVGGRHKAPMAELRDLASGLGFGDVATYIQSGNLVFSSPLDEATAARDLERAIEHRFGFFVPVVMRSADELATVASKHPLERHSADPRFLMVAFLDVVPAVAIESVIDAADHAPDRFVGSGRDVYLAYPNGSARSKLTHALLQQRLGVRATIRNWNTVQKLVTMTGGRT